MSKSVKASQPGAPIDEVLKAAAVIGGIALGLLALKVLLGGAKDGEK